MLIAILQICLYYNMLLIRLSDKIKKKDSNLVLVPKQAVSTMCDDQVNLVANPISGKRDCFTLE